MRGGRVIGLGAVLVLGLLRCSGGGDTANPGAVCEPSAQETGVHIDPAVYEPGHDRLLVKTREWGWRLILPGADPAFSLRKLLARKDLEAIEPDFPIHETSVTPNDPDYGRQWAHEKVNSPEAWGLTRGDGRVVVAIIDGGLDTHHPDLRSNIWHNPREVINGVDDDGNGFVDDVEGWDFVNDDNGPEVDSPSHVHGTHVAGIVAAVGDNGIGISGHAPQIKIMPLKYIDVDGSGYTSGAIRAIDYAIENGADIINASWSSNTNSRALYDAIARARAKGVLVVVAAGNDGLNIDENPRYPASYKLDNILAVAATDLHDALASFSNFGLKTADVAAPGISIYSTSPGGRYVLLSGTSMSAPVVSAIAALVKSRHPLFKARELALSIFASVEKNGLLTNRVRFGGRVNAYLAMRAADDIAEGKWVAPQSWLCP